MCHSTIRGWSGFTVYLAPSALTVAVIRMVCLASVIGQTNQGLQAAFSLTLQWPGFHFLSRGSITHYNGRRQTSGHNSYSSAWSYCKPEDGGGEGERGRGRPTLQGPSWLTGTTDPAILESHKSMLLPPPSTGMAYFLNKAIVSWNTKFSSSVFPHTDPLYEWVL